MNTTPITSPPADLIRSAVEVLAQGELLLQEVGDPGYSTRVAAAFNASIGGHYRHCLDHFRNLLGAVETGDLNYDDRDRDTLIEKDRFAALNETRRLRETFERLTEAVAARKVSVECRTSYTADSSQRASSTVGREIMYAVAHAVHHYALIGVIGHLLGVKLPPGFGVAPSTLKHQAEAGAGQPQA